MNVVAAEIVPLTGGALFCLYALRMATGGKT
jgi:hypothetical protein